MRIVGLAIIACLLCALKTNAYSADLDPDTLSVRPAMVGSCFRVHRCISTPRLPMVRVPVLCGGKCAGTAAAISSTNTLQTTVSVPADVSSAETLPRRAAQLDE